MNNFFSTKEGIENKITSNCAFALWRKPNRKKIHQIQCAKNEILKINNYTELDKVSGFLFAPFKITKDTPAFILPFTEKNTTFDFIEKVNLSTSKKDKKQQSVSKNEYIDQCKHFIKSCKKGGIKKAVLAQNHYFTQYGLADALPLFFRLCEAYPSAFVYQVFIPEAGLWMGATPELLLKINKQKAQTVALAATQSIRKNVKNIKWKEKEIEEQALVVEHIRETLTAFDLNDYKEKPVKAVKAGDIAHLKTKITFNPQKIRKDLGQFISQLHPTPAICGLPVKKALALIKETENFSREYYAGFLGEFEPQKNIHLFVNLRCLKAFKKSICLYSGAGITSQSEPEKEWEETQIKMQTLLKIIKKQI